MSAETSDQVSKAVAVVTAWNEGGRGSPLAVETLTSYVVEGGEKALGEVTMGLISVCGLLLDHIERVEGAPAGTTLQAIAAEYGG